MMLLVCTAATFTLPANAEITPLLFMLAELRFTLPAACMIGLAPVTPAGRLLVMEPPALMLRFLELVMMPPLTTLLIATKLMLRWGIDQLIEDNSEPGSAEDNTAPGLLKILVAVIDATFVAELELNA